MAEMNLGNPAHAVAAYLEAFHVMPRRVESLYKLVEHYRVHGKHQTAMMYLNYVTQALLPTITDKEKSQHLFLENDKYTHLFDYEFNILAYYCLSDAQKADPSILRSIFLCSLNALNHLPYPSPPARCLLRNLKFYKDMIRPVRKFDLSDTYHHEGLDMDFRSSSTSMIPVIDNDSMLMSRESDGHTVFMLNTRYVNYHYDQKTSAVTHPKGMVVTLNRRSIFCYDVETNTFIPPLTAFCLSPKILDLEGDWVVFHPKEDGFPSGEETITNTDPFPVLQFDEKHKDSFQSRLHGLEDVRLYQHRLDEVSGGYGSVEFMATCVQRHNERRRGTIAMSYGDSYSAIPVVDASMMEPSIQKVVRRDYIELDTTTISTTTGLEKLMCEKNWVFIPRNCLGDTTTTLLPNERFVVHLWSPLRICRLNTTTGILHPFREMHPGQLPSLFKMLRGSAHGCMTIDKRASESGKSVAVRKQLWFLTHFVVYGENREMEYYHVVVVMDFDMTRVIAYTTPFKFEGCAIEYALSLVLMYDDHVIIPYSTWDTTTNIAVYDRQEFESRFIYL